MAKRSGNPHDRLPRTVLCFGQFDVGHQYHLVVTNWRESRLRRRPYRKLRPMTHYCDASFDRWIVRLLPRRGMGWSVSPLSHPLRCSDTDIVDWSYVKNVSSQLLLTGMREYDPPVTASESSMARH